MVKRNSQPPQRLESLMEALGNALATEATSAQQNGDLEAQYKTWEKSRCRKLMENILEVLLQAEEKACNSRGLSECLEHALEIGVFDLIAGFGQMDRPAGVLASVLSFYSRILSGVKKELLIPNVAFHRSVKSLLLTIAENLKKGHVFYRVDEETLEFLYGICERVQRLPLLLEILLVKDTGMADEYLPITILLHYFKQSKYDSNPKMRELMHFCVQVDKREVMERLISHTDFSSALIFKLVFLFKQLPDNGKISGKTGFSEELTNFVRYCEFLDQLCQKCLWQDLLSSLGGIFHYHFCEKVVFPRLSTYPISTLQVTFHVVFRAFDSNCDVAYPVNSDNQLFSRE